MSQEETALDPPLDTSPEVADEVKTTTCYMCACRCGIRVSLKNGKVRHIQGNSQHPVNKGVLCAKGAAGIMNQYSPARLRKPLRRIGPRGSGQFKEIEWDEALSTAATWLSDIRQTDPRKLGFFTGRDQSQSLTSWWAQQFGTPNYAAHGGLCSVNMATAGFYTVGGSFWEFGEPDWEHTKYLLLFGIAEDHNSNPIKIGLSKLKARGTKIVSINPVRTGYSAIADEWIGIRPGTDGLLIMALAHELMRAGKVDLEYLARFTDASWLVIDAPNTADDGIFLRDDDDVPLCWDRVRNVPVSRADADLKPALTGRYRVNGLDVTPAFELMAKRILNENYSPKSAAERCGIPTTTIRRIASEIAHIAFDQSIELPIPWTDSRGEQHPTMTGRPVAVHAMRGISAHTNGFHTCRALHLLQLLLGAVDTPGSFRFKPPYPKPCPPGQKPGGRSGTAPNKPLDTPPLGFVTSPDDLLIDDSDMPIRLDKAFSWEYPLAAQGMLHSVIRNAWAGTPYPIDTLFLYMTNLGWNSSMNTLDTLSMLQDKDPSTGNYKIPHIIYSDAFYSETVAYADLVLPDTTYLERWDCISLWDRPISDADTACDAIRQPVVKPDYDVRPFQTVLLDLGSRLGLPEMVNENGSNKFPGGYADYMVNHMRKSRGPLAGWRGPNGTPNPNQLEAYVDNGCFWKNNIPEDARYYKFANQAYLDWAKSMDFLSSTETLVMHVYAEPLQRFRNAARGLTNAQPPDHLKQRIEQYFDPLPFWYEPFEDSLISNEEFSFHALTQRPMHHYHSWGSQNAWLRQITSQNRLFMSIDVATEMNISDNDWVWIESRQGRVKGQVKLVDGVNPRTVWTWNAIAKRSGAWGLNAGANETTVAFLLNHIIPDEFPDYTGGVVSNSDPITGQAAWFDLRVKIYKLDAGEYEKAESLCAALEHPPGLQSGPNLVTYGAEFRNKSADP